MSVETRVNIDHPVFKTQRIARTFAKTGRRIAACAAGSLLEMQRALATTPASDMSLVVPLTKAGSTLAYHL